MSKLNDILKFFKNLPKIISRHKVISGIIIILIIIIGYSEYKHIKNGSTETRYVLAQVQKGTIVSSVSGSGQVSASNQIDIKSKVSGDALRVLVTNGQQVDAGTLLVQLDNTDAFKTVRDAQANLQSAQLSLQKLIEPADELSITQAENALAQAQDSKQNAQAGIIKAYDDGFNNVANTFIDLPSIITGLNSILFSYDYNPSQWNIGYYSDAVANYDQKVLDYKNDAYNKYQTARDAYDKTFQDYKSLSRSSDTSAIDSIINETYDTTKDIADAVKAVNNLILFYQDKLTEHNIKPQTLSTTQLSSLSSYTGKTNNDLSNLLSIKNTIVSDNQAITDADRSITEKNQSLAKLKAGADTLDIQSQQLSIKQKQNALLDAQQNLAYYSIKAPFSGVIASITPQKGDSVSANGTIATLITQQKTAEVSLNEVDVTKVKTGQKATLTFDAIPDLTITGEVSEVETIGTVSQGVVSYNVKITFDTQDDRVKPGMSVSAAIITDAKQDVLLVPNAAVKQQNQTSYVQVPTETNIADATNTSGVVLKNIPTNKTVEVGTSNDTHTEITSGLNEGDFIVIRTTQAVATKTTQTSATQSSIFRFTGGGGGGR